MKPEPQVSVTGDVAGSGFPLHPATSPPPAPAGGSEASPGPLSLFWWYGDLQWGPVTGPFVLGVGVFLGTYSCVVGPCGSVVLVLGVLGSERSFVYL